MPVQRSLHDYMLTREIAEEVLLRAAESRNGFLKAASDEAAASVEAVAEGHLLDEEQKLQLKELECLEGPSVTILIEMNCVQGCLSMRHNPLKYDRYFWAFVEAIGSEIVSPTGQHTVRVMVEATTAVCDPASTDSISQYPNQSRYGAFEIYMIPHMPNAEHLSSCMGVFSKLLSRRWPHIPALVERCKALIQPAFLQWDADAGLKHDMSSRVLDLNETKNLLEVYSGRVQSTLQDELEALRNIFEEADEAISSVTKEFDIALLKQVIEQYECKASPGVIAEAGMRLAQLEANEALRNNDEALRSTAADPAELREAIARFKERASGETLYEAESRLRTLDANMTLRSEVSRVYEADDIRTVIEKYHSSASEDALKDAAAKLDKVMGADQVIMQALDVDIDAIHRAIAEHLSNASPSVVVKAEERVIELEAEEAIESARSDADSWLRSMPYEPDPERMLKMIELHSELASWPVIEEAVERLRFLRQDIKFQEEMAAATEEMRAEIEPLMEQAEIREAVDKYRDTAYEAAIADVDVVLTALDNVDAALAASMRGELDSIPALEAALEQARETASPSLVARAEALLLRLKTDKELGIALLQPNASDIRTLMEPCRENASSEAWEAATAHVESIEAADATINEATVRGPPESVWHGVTETASRDDIDKLTTALSEQSASASPTVVAPAEVLLTEWVADDALHRVQLGVDITSVETSLLLAAAVGSHFPPARAMLTKEIEVIYELSAQIIRELQADAAVRRLLRSTGMEEAESIRTILDQHGDYAASPLVAQCTAKLSILDEADEKLLAAVAEAMRIPTPPDSDDEEMQLDTPKSRMEEQPVEKSVADKIFQAITEHGPLASRSVRQAVWRQGGSAVNMPPPPEKPSRKMNRMTDSPHRRRLKKDSEAMLATVALNRAFSKSGMANLAFSRSFGSGLAALAAQAAASQHREREHERENGDSGAGVIPNMGKPPPTELPIPTLKREVSFSDRFADMQPSSSEAPSSSLDAMLGSQRWDESVRDEEEESEAAAVAAPAPAQEDAVNATTSIEKAASAEADEGTEAAVEAASEADEPNRMDADIDTLFEEDEEDDFAKMLREEEEEEAKAEAKFSLAEAWETDLWGAPAEAESEDHEIAAMANEMISSAAMVLATEG